MNKINFKIETIMSKKIRRNDPCPCGSGKKYKKCCGNPAIQDSLAKSVAETKEPCTLNQSVLPKTTLGELTLYRLLRNKEMLESSCKLSKEDILQVINDLEDIFKTYDKIQLLGALGLHLLYVEVIRKDDLIDEDIEPLLEYAMSFAFAYGGNSQESPSDEVICSMYDKLLCLKRSYNDIELLESLHKAIPRDLLNHLAFINVRGDAYAPFIEEVFDEYFIQHESFISEHYKGATLVEIHALIRNIENRIICRLQDSSAYGILGATKLWNQWKAWAEKHEDDFFENIPDGKNPIMGGFLRDNPEIPRTLDGHPILYDYQSYNHANDIFSIIPNNEMEEALLNAMSCQFGDNADFMQGEYRGSILNYATIIRQKPFLKYNGKYYCFSVLLPHRRMFELTSDLLKIDNSYFETHHLGNAFPECRDNFIEHKVFNLFSIKFPNICFYQSVGYQGIDGEMDILGVSDKAVYLIEIKAYQLTDKYRGGTIGIEKKMQESIGKAASQCQRSRDYILESHSVKFSCSGHSNIIVTDAIPSYKMCITLEHYGGLTCNMKGLVDMNIIDASQRDICILSLYDLMAVLDNIKDESQLVDYLNIHNRITISDDVVYNDEMNLLGTFLTNPIVLNERPLTLISGSEIIDEKYQSNRVKCQI